MWYYGDMHQLPYCCGFYEVGNFDLSTAKPTYPDIIVDNLEDFLETIFSTANGRPVIFNFVQGYDEDAEEFNDDYDASEIHNFIVDRPGVIDLGTHINPGTNNRIHSLVIKDYK